MKISSLAFSDSQIIPKQYTCDGENISPPLKFEDVPSNARSLVLIVDDPDAPGKTWVHWVLYNIDPKTEKIEENSSPSGAALGLSDFGELGYGGPCPPSGTHRYFFKLYALNITLDLPAGPRKQDIEEAMKGHILEKSELIGHYARK